MAMHDDHTRIVLDVPAESTHTDYINANYVPGYQSPRKFIASQGPTTIIMDDFWRMVWQEKCTKIVVLTQIIEGGKIKCDQYWPNTGSLSYGNVQVEMVNVEDYADFSIRNLLIKSSEAHENRLVKQFHFKAWPDHGVPEYPTALISFWEKVTTTRTSGRGPIVVHCSAGIGRTGTYIGLDYLIEQANAEGKVDVFGCVNTMRYYRVNMIQTEEQYEFLHDSLLEALSLSAMSMPSFDFIEKYAILKKTNTQSGKTYLQEQFDLLNLLTQSGNPTDSAFSEVPENMCKNRDPNVVAADDHRVYLATPIKDTNDYINAVFLPAYKESKKFIITQMPLANTVIDFWRMIYENKCRTIIMLNDDTIQDGSCYWPKERSTLSIGPFTITSDMDTEGDLYTMKPLRLKYSEEPGNAVNIQLFQSKIWSRSESVPQDASLIVTFLEDVEHWQQSTGNNMIVVHCINGVERSGLYCSVNAVIDRLKVEQQVHISQTVKLLRARRPQIITNVEQFQFCHDAVVAYLESFHTYSNFT